MEKNKVLRSEKLNASFKTGGFGQKRGKKKTTELYTRYEDIETELMRYKRHFEGKTVLLNCDDAEESNF